MTRSVALWIGATDDAPAPTRVRIRVFERCNGRCHRCGRKIRPGDSWTLEHLIALINGGRNAEDNMCLTCAWCLPIKNAEDVAIKAKSARVRARHLGIKPKRSRFQSRGFTPAEPQRRATTPHHKHIGQFDADISKSER
jgi:hypothetical protein